MTKLVEMKSIAQAPHAVLGIGIVESGGIFKCTEEQALILEKGLYERVKPETKAKKGKEEK
jgi:hypothetical protein